MKEEFIPLLRKGVEWVEEQDKLDPAIREWVQAEWVVDEETRVENYDHRGECGTGRCLAGYLGMQLAPEDFKDSWRRDRDSLTVDAYVEEVMDIDPYIYNIDEKAYDSLWADDNTAQDIRRLAEEIAGQPL